jgi:hypothetical protein
MNTRQEWAALLAEEYRRDIEGYLPDLEAAAGVGFGRRNMQAVVEEFAAGFIHGKVAPDRELMDACREAGTILAKDYYPD